ncbi:MAG: SpoIID/LytB domain-containing protein [bacterium]|jgi:stage II sporulation protein D
MFRFRYYSTLGFLLIVGVLALSGNGCSILRKPEETPKPPPADTDNRVLQMVEAGEEPVLRVFIDQTGETKEMKMEEYLAGVVTAEMETDWPIEALAAQAILARTFTLEAIKDKGGVPQHGTDACTLVEHFQAYDAEAVNERVKEAVEMTRGEVALYKGDYIKAWFSAYAGEKTAHAKEGLAFKEEEPPYIKSVDNPGKKYAPDEHKSWSVSFSTGQVQQALAQMGHEVAEVNSIAIGDKGPSGRAQTIRINDELEVAGADLRIALGSTELKSIFLEEITINGDRVTFKGQGYGHGVGMCQWGAYGLAKEGKKPEEIVDYYFTDIEVAKLWD